MACPYVTVSVHDAMRVEADLVASQGCHEGRPY
jgi:hypothetical protein